MKGVLKITLPPQELEIVNVPVAGKQPVVKLPDKTYVPEEQTPGNTAKELQLGAE